MPETVPCLICGAADSITQTRKTRFANVPAPLEVARCTACGFEQLNPRLTIEEYARHYVTHPYYQATNATRGATRGRFYNAKIARLERWRPQRGRLLVIGCVDGGYAAAVAQARGWQVEAVEFSPILAAHARGLGVRTHLSRGWDLSVVEGREFDAVYSHSLEHVPFPRQTVQQCRQLLAADGLLFVEVPNQFGSVVALLKRAVFRVADSTIDRWLIRDDKTEFHTCYFVPKTLDALLERAGFVVLTRRTYLPWHPIYLRKGGAVQWVQESLHALGGVIGRGPCIEIVARRK